jgi:hypothetical protein
LSGNLGWGEELLSDSDSDFALLEFLNALGDLRLVVAYSFITKGTTDEAFDGVDDLTGMAGDARECRFTDDGLTGFGVETTEGVMRSPSRLCRTLACPVYGSQMAMAELVVPKSIPRISTLFTAYFSLSSYLKLNNNN